MTCEHYDEGYDEGYEDGLRDGNAEAREDADPPLPVEDALTRLAYLQTGGEWHRETTGDLYVEGFKDALKTLGVIK